MNLRTKIEEAIKDIPLWEGHNGDGIMEDTDRAKAVDQICTIFKEEIDQKFRKHRLPTNCSWAMAIKEQIQTQRTCPTCNGIIYLDNPEWDGEEQKYYYRHIHNCEEK